MQTIFTIGYEGTDIDKWLETLKKAGVEVLVDIREIPISRKKGYSKKSLQKFLEAQGIEYVHYKTLGSPKEIRDQLHKDKKYAEFFLKFDDYLNTQSQALDEVFQISQEKKVALMCYEHNHKQCHRQIVAFRIKDISPETIEIVHLYN